MLESREEQTKANVHALGFPEEQKGGRMEVGGGVIKKRERVNDE